MTEHKHPHIDMHEVNGSQIHSIGYDPATQTLRIAFPNRKSGLVQSTYDYANVTQATFDDLINADSCGEYFEWHIKPHTETYPYKKLVEEDPRGKTTDATHGAPQATASPQAPVASTSPISRPSDV